MRVKISDRMTEVKIEKWMSGEFGVFNKSDVNCLVNDVDDCLLRNRGIIYYDMSWMDDSFGSVGLEW